VIASVSARADEPAPERDFPKTLTIDEPGVDDEVSLPTLQYQSYAASPDGPARHETNASIEIDKLITDDIDLQINDGYTNIDRVGATRRIGWQDLEITVKYVLATDEEHEFILSVAAERDFGGTGARMIGADQVGSTTPILYFGKGLGDLDIGYLRPFAVTGAFGYNFPDQSTEPGSSEKLPQHALLGGSLQYSFAYLDAEIGDQALGPFARHLIGIVEFAYDAPTTHGGTTTGTIAPGLLYAGDGFQVGIEAVVPQTRSSGNSVGVIAQLNLSLGLFAPSVLGKPLF
jgi:hypothetical protein